MGFNTAVLLLNDHIHSIRENPPQFAENLMRAIEKHWSVKPGETVDFGVGNCCNGGTVFHQAHADNTGVYAIGGNYASKLLISPFGQHHTPEGQLILIREMAEKLEYRLTKKKTAKESYDRG